MFCTMFPVPIFLIITMENDQFRKKVYMQTHSSTLINPKPSLLPEWVSQNQINFTSSYEFSTYNVEAETIDIIPRHQHQSQALLVDFKKEMSDIHNQMYYLYQEREAFYMVHQYQQDRKKILIYKKDVEQKSETVQKFLDFIIKNQDQKMFSNKNLINKTQQLIEEIKQEETQKNHGYEFDIQSIVDMKIVYECNFAVLLVQMKGINGIMLVNIAKAKLESQKEFRCGFTTINLGASEPEIEEDDTLSSKLIYIFPQRLVEIHRTRDISQFVILTQNNILLAKVNYEQMELCIVNKIKIVGKFNNRVVSVRINQMGPEDTYITGLVEVSRQVSMKVVKEKKKRLLKLFKIEDKKIVQLQVQNNYSNCLKYQNYQQKTLKFLDEPSQRTLNIKFSSNVVHSRYQISQQDSDDPNPFNNNIIMNVFNNMMNEEQKSQQKILSEKEDKSKKLFLEDNSLGLIEPMVKSSTEKAIKEIGGFISNKNMIVMWEKDSSVLHLCKIVTKKELQERYQKDKDVICNKSEYKMHMKEKEMKDIYAQLMGNPVTQKKDAVLNFQSRIQYIKRVELELPYSKVTALSVSPNNYNLLIVSSNGASSKESLSYSIFQLQLFTQLSNPDPNMFLKSIKYIYKNKPTDHIATSLVRELPIYLTGNLVHTSENELIDGALSFDIHPCHLFLAVSFGFTSKIYAFQGNERLSSLHTINLQGIKQLKYNPMGNHLCLLASKSIKVIDCYSFHMKFIIHQKNSNFSKCFFSTNGQKFYTISENNYINIYNTFDYTKTDCIKPLTGDYKPISIKNYAKYLQYCIVLENGSMLVRYSSEAIVVSHEMIYKYLDNEKISCIEIDEKNGILFVGCASGKLRAHIWPLKEEQYFDQFSEIRIGFTPIQSMALSNLHYNLYIGSSSGNTSKVKFVIDRDRGTSTDGNPLFTQSNLKYVNMNGNNNIEKVYKFVVANYSSANEELPEKMRLEYKLSEVINKLNEEMHKLKSQIKEEIQEKMKQTGNKFDINLYHHLNRMITTKLSTQYLEEQDANHKELEGLKHTQKREMKKMLEEQNELLKEKSIVISRNVAQRNLIKEQCQKQMAVLLAEQEKESQQIQKRVEYTKKRNDVKDEELYHLPSHAYDYEEQKADLLNELETLNRNYYDLRKECAYKQTAIKGMSSKKAKEESLEFKFDIQTKQMEKKYQYNQNVLSSLKRQIQEAEDKVHIMQAQATVIKNNAQFKKVANLDEMNDACSYKLWVKEKTEKEIQQLYAYLREIQEFLQGKSSEMVDLVFSKTQKMGQIAQLEEQVQERKKKLTAFKFNLINSKNKMRKADPQKDYKELISSTTRDHSNLKTEPPAKNLQRMHSTRQIVNNNKDVQLFNSIMDKQMNSLKTTMKIHKRKIKNFGKENGELLTEFQKLKYENKSLDEQRQINCKMLKSVKKEMKNEMCSYSPSKDNIEITLTKTSFQKYLANKEKRQGIASKCKTATHTPTHLSTACLTPGLLSPRIYD